MNLTSGDTDLRGVILLELVICSCPRNCKEKAGKHLEGWTDVLLRLTMLYSVGRSSHLHSLPLFFSLSLLFPSLTSYTLIASLPSCLLFLLVPRLPQSLLRVRFSDDNPQPQGMEASWARKDCTHSLSSESFPLNSHFPQSFHKAFWSFTLNNVEHTFLRLFRQLSSKESACQYRRCKFNPWVRKIPGVGNGTHSSILAWEIPWTEELVGSSPRGCKRVGHTWAA